MTAGAFGAWRRLAREDVWLLRHTLLVIERLYERWLLYFPPYRSCPVLNRVTNPRSMFEYSNLTGDRTLGMRRLQKVANDIRHLLDQHSCIRVAGLRAWVALTRIRTPE